MVHITLPALKPTIITLTLMAIGRIFYSDFGLFYQVPMNSGPLLDVTNTIDTYVYRGLMSLNNISMASAAVKTLCSKGKDLLIKVKSKIQKK